MIDLHSHILPAYDDGVRDEEEAIELARLFVEEGAEVIVATPHCKEGVWEIDRAGVLERVAELRKLLVEAGVELHVEPGAEVHLCPDLVQRVKDGRAPTIADNGVTLLLELSLTQYPIELENLVFQLKVAGHEVVFAHPERIAFFQDDIARYEKIVRLGAYGQLTTGRILGLFGSDAREFSKELLRKGLVHIMASDAHNLRKRSPRIRDALRATVPLVGEARTRAMVEEAPRAMIEGRQPELPPVEGRSGRRRTILSRLLRR